MLFSMKKLSWNFGFYFTGTLLRPSLVVCSFGLNFEKESQLVYEMETLMTVGSFLSFVLSVSRVVDHFIRTIRKSTLLYYKKEYGSRVSLNYILKILLY